MPHSTTLRRLPVYEMHLLVYLLPALAPVRGLRSLMSGEPHWRNAARAFALGEMGNAF
jgi:hypothetical protein